MTFAEHLPALQVIVPLLAAPLVVMLQPRGLAWAASAAAAVFSFVIAINLAAGVLAGQQFVYEMGGWKHRLGLRWVSTLFLPLFCWL